jgi:hypothetical protein
MSSPFNENKRPTKKKTKLSVKGKKIFHPIYINWSNLNRGKFALTKINKKVIPIDFIPKKNPHQDALKTLLGGAIAHCFIIRE